MDWMSFWFGLMVGVIGLAAVLMTVGTIWLRPYFRKAKKHTREAVNIQASDLWTHEGWDASKDKK